MWSILNLNLNLNSADLVSQVHRSASSGDHIWEGDGDLFCVRTNLKWKNTRECNIFMYTCIHAYMWQVMLNINIKFKFKSLFSSFSSSLLSPRGYSFCSRSTHTVPYLIYHTVGIQQQGGTRQAGQHTVNIIILALYYYIILLLPVVSGWIN